jgi:uncharacterized protein (DUF362 family)
MIAEINSAYSPDPVVLDGVEAFVGGDPTGATKPEVGVMLTGIDRVAIDAVGVAIPHLSGTTPRPNYTVCVAEFATPYGIINLKLEKHRGSQVTSSILRDRRTCSCGDNLFWKSRKE